MDIHYQNLLMVLSVCSGLTAAPLTSFSLSLSYDFWLVFSQVIYYSFSFYVNVDIQIGTKGSRT